MLCCALLTLGSGCALLSDDPRLRAPGAVIGDQRIEGRLRRQIRRADAGFLSAHLNIVSYNGIVLLAGQVGSQTLLEQAGTVARSSRGVRQVYNALTVGGPTSYLARTNDGWLTAKAKTRLLAARDVPGQRIKVVTENGTLYLLGILPRDQADAAVTAVRQVYGLQRIVKVFEYLDEPSFTDGSQPSLAHGSP